MSECKREFHIAGDYIENQTNNFYDHSQYNSTGAVMNEKKGKDARAPKPERKSTLPKPDPKPADGKLPEQMTFSKRGITDIHLSFLYKKMVEDGWLTDDTKEANFKALFSGERTPLTITWAGKYGRGTLVYFFQQIAFHWA